MKGSAVACLQPSVARLGGRSSVIPWWSLSRLRCTIHVSRTTTVHLQFVGLALPSTAFAYVSMGVRSSRRRSAVHLASDGSGVDHPKSRISTSEPTYCFEIVLNIQIMNMKGPKRVRAMQGRMEQQDITTKHTRDNVLIRWHPKPSLPQNRYAVPLHRRSRLC